MTYKKIILETERLLLRPFDKKDIEEISRLCNNFNIYKSTLNIPYPYTEKEAETWIDSHREKFEKGKLFEFAITDKKTGKLYGAIGISNNKKNDNGEIGYWIGEEYWNNGYATEGARAVLDMAFETLEHKRVFGRCFSNNLGSGRVLEKIGMKYEGRLKNHIKKDKKYIDLLYYGIVKEDR